MFNQNNPVYGIYCLYIYNMFNQNNPVYGI